MLHEKIKSAYRSFFTKRLPPEYPEVIFAMAGRTSVSWTYRNEGGYGSMKSTGPGITSTSELIGLSCGSNCNDTIQGFAEYDYGPGIIQEVRPKTMKRKRVGGGTRSKIRGFSARSRRSMLQFMLSVDWSRYGLSLLVTLTYPGPDFPRPSNGRAAKRHLRRFMDRWQRRFGTKSCLWKMEFQRDGSPHFHLRLEAPSGVALKTVQEWIALAWWKVVGSHSPKHLKAGTWARYARTQRGWMLYFAKRNGYQNSPPTGFETGCLWGRWQVTKCTQTLVLHSPQEAIAFRRLLKRWKRSRSIEGQASRKFTLMPKGVVATNLVEQFKRAIR